MSFGPTPEMPMTVDEVERHCYPPFIKPILCRENNKLVYGLDGWCVSPMGEWSSDYSMGQFYAEEAVFHARYLGWSFLAFVLAALVAKGGSHFGATENGFLDRIARFASAGALN
jgi:hypothetical protein